MNIQELHTSIRTISLCENEGEDIYIEGITGPCIRCFCKLSTVDQGFLKGGVIPETGKFERFHALKCVLSNQMSTTPLNLPLALGNTIGNIEKGCNFKGKQLSDGESFTLNSDPCTKCLCQGYKLQYVKEECCPRCIEDQCPEGARFKKCTKKCERTCDNPYTRRKISDFWVGGEDDLIEGEWTWAETDEPFDFTDWIHGQPDNSNDEDCLSLWKANSWEWNDASCETHSYYICERA
ncbi:unnamed protein product [Mytilus coruscus]|uniref:C-type lectin domain-containing protein n=1 Tax=Mytilus coruscus TaxID=42192 RepID=A0A6J8DUI2_MYTCO|nr:unnamed protein product [Mytilus coruscus]